MNRYALGMVFILLSCSSLSFAESERRVWRIASLEWQPYTGSDLESGGRSIEILRHLLAQSDIELQVDFFPWKRAKEYAKSEAYIGYFPAWPYEIDQGFIASPAVDWSWISVVHHQSTKVSSRKLADLFRDYRVAVIEPYTYPAEVYTAALWNPQNTVWITDEYSMLLMLEHRHVDIGLTDGEVVKYYAEKLDISDVVVAYHLIRAPLVLALRDTPENQQVIREITRLLNSRL